EDHGVLGPLQCRDPLLQPAVEVEAPGDEPRRARPGAVGLERRARPADDAGGVGQAQVVVRGEEEVRDPGDLDLGPGRAGAIGERAEELSLAEVAERLGEPLETGRRHAPSVASRMASTVTSRSRSSWRAEMARGGMRTTTSPRGRMITPRGTASSATRAP